MNIMKRIAVANMAFLYNVHMVVKKIQSAKMTKLSTPLDSISRIQLVSNIGTDRPSRLQQNIMLPCYHLQVF